MADWFAGLMQRGHARGQRAVVRTDVQTDAGAVRRADTRDGRYDMIVQRLREREREHRDAREKRQRWYKQSLERESATEVAESSGPSPDRLHKLRTKVPCRMTPEARALLDQLGKRFAGCTVSFSQLANGQQAVMLTGRAGATRKQIGWIEQSVEADPKLFNVSSQGLSVETDGGSMLVLRFRYPSTTVRMCRDRASSPSDVPGIHESVGHTRDECGIDVASMEPGAVQYVEFAELRAALDLRPAEKDSSPRLVWLTRSELDTINDLQSLDYEAFYVRFKLEVQAGIWSSLLGSLSDLPGSHWHQGSCYTVVREPDAAIRKIRQGTVDDSGRAIDVGQDRTYDAAPATDILLLHLEGDILAECADIYFTLQSLGSTDSYFLKEEFFTVIRRFWASAQSLTSSYGGDRPAIVRMSQRALPMPAQSPMLKQDWTKLRQRLIDRYGATGEKAAELSRAGIHRQRSERLDWPFASFPAGEVNIGLRLIYRQEWRNVGAQRGEVLRTVALGTEDVETAVIEQTQVVGATTEKGPPHKTLDVLVSEVERATVDAMKWPVDLDGRIHIGVRELSARTEMGVEAECRESSRDTSLHLSEVGMRMASAIGEATSVEVSVEQGQSSISSSSADIEAVNEVERSACVFNRLHNVYEVLTRPAEIQSVVLVAEKLPTPAEIDRAWVTRHDWIIAKALLDESFREALDTIGREPQEEGEQQELLAKRERLYEHLRVNILHYQHAVWQQEDPQQRSLRYRKSGKRVPLEWRFELESGSDLTIDALADRLAATNVDGHFAAYSPGPDAGIDQLIDPAGLIGHHGNYAVFRMRPEFGSGRLFAMLHFFKSPYLRPSPQTGEAEVDDPAGDETLFRRERTRRISLKTNSVVRDAVHSARAAKEIERREEDRAEAAPVGCELLLESAPRVELLTSNPRGDPEIEPAVVARGEAELLAGHASAPPPDSSDDSATVARTFGGRRPTLCVGQTCESAVVQEIRATGEATGMRGVVTGVGPPAGERLIHSSDDSSQSIGRSHDPKAGSGIVTQQDRDSIFVSAPRRETAAIEEPALSLGGEDAAARLRVGWEQLEAARVIIEPETGGLRLSSGIGGGAARAHERVTLAAGDLALTANLVAGAGASNEYEHMVLTQDDEWLRPSLVVG